MLPSFQLSVPDSWTLLELASPNRDAVLRRSVEASVGRSLPRPHVEKITRQLRKAARESQALGAVFAAGMFDFADGGAIQAIVTGAVVKPPEGADLSLAGLLASLGRPEPERPGGPWARIGPVDLPAGPAARLTGVDDLDLPGAGAQIRCAVTHTLVPAPGGERVVAIMCASPNMSLVPQLHELFDAVTGTLVFLE
ncbi:hypothetical protein Afil01_12440 [Actinorhabdospora filicis]|uniref:Uncharacterized protein n=1 Tax=Actinorhabdospora filicis TaxID=1785913 RepID=A0A9W6SI81_9ACTN|nr:hypothetical protein [Actinorhabdospora filicis]GLZ76437.1 hypothetical protein Afil01_12440 [Actinorhabdospora filicis]